MRENDMREIADLIHRAVIDTDGSAAADIAVEVGKLVERHPAYPRESQATD
jgi:glycine/serine hydroxymethyltransferase